MVVVGLIKRNVGMSTKTKQRLEFIRLRYRDRRTGATDMPVEADDLVGFGHDHVKVVGNHQDPALKVIPNGPNELIQLVFT